MGFLALIPAKDWLYGAIITALLISFGVYTAHERDIGKAKEAAAVASATKKALDAAAKQNEIRAAADAKINQSIEADFNAKLSASTAANGALAQRLRDYESARSSGRAVPGDPATPGSPDVPAAQPASVDDAVAAVIEAAGHDADQVIALQNYIGAVCLK
jgi:hypothetical protein